MAVTASNSPYWRMIVFAMILGCLYLARLYDYLLFHFIAETFSIVIAVCVFLFAWNTHEFSENDYSLFLGIAFVGIAGVDLLHTLAYQGMNLFKGYDRDLPTQLWLIARALQAAALALAPFYLTRKLKLGAAWLAFPLLTAGLVAAAFGGVFPRCFVEGSGLTAFKKVSEWMIGGILLVAAGHLYRERAQLDRVIYGLLMAAMITMILAEGAFTLYTDVYGLANMVGHFLKIVAFYLIYKAIIECGLRRPYALLFRKLKRREEALTQALDEVKTLRGIVPICAACKKIRDDQGYWQQVDVYLHEHTEADFSHGICPECLSKLYPEYEEDPLETACG